MAPIDQEVLKQAMDDAVKAVTEKNADMCREDLLDQIDTAVAEESLERAVCEILSTVEELQNSLKSVRAASAGGCIVSIVASWHARRSKKLLQSVQEETSEVCRLFANLSKAVPAQKEAAASLRKVVAELRPEFGRIKALPVKLSESITREDPAPIQENLHLDPFTALLAPLHKESDYLAWFNGQTTTALKRLSEFTERESGRQNILMALAPQAEPSAEVQALLGKLTKLDELGKELTSLMGPRQKTKWVLRALIQLLEGPLPDYVSHASEHVTNLVATLSQARHMAEGASQCLEAAREIRERTNTLKTTEGARVLELIRQLKGASFQPPTSVVWEARPEGLQSPVALNAPRPSKAEKKRMRRDARRGRNCLSQA